MESGDGSSNAHVIAYYPNRHAPMTPLSPYPFLSDGDLKGASYHQRCSSESFLFDEEPAWLSDLLDEPEEAFPYRCHRRSVSDSYAYLGESIEKLNIGGDYGYSYVGKANIMSETHSSAERKNQGIAVSSASLEQTKDESSSKCSEGSADKSSGGSHVKPYASKAEGKRARQHNAHRSRARKLQYIVHLEKTVEMLKAEGCEVSADLEFLEQQNIILSMENRTLRQRLESVSQEQAIKQWEQGMLEREIARLQNMFHVQKHQQFHQQHYKHRRNKSKSFDHKVNYNNNQVKIEDASSSQALAHASVWA